MAELLDWAFPADWQPTAGELRFDLEPVLDAVVLLRSEIPEDAFTASILGTERTGSAVVIRDDGLMLTIGYLITEAQTIWLTTNDGTFVAGHPLAYDAVSGFGLVQPLGRLGAPALARGAAASAKVGDEAIVIAHGGRAHALKARIIAKREFAGYWEYVLDEALFTSPAHPEWGGAALVDADGRLLGIGSLLVQEALDGEPVQGNMFVPIDLLAPILDDMLKFAAPARPPRPWLGMYTAEVGQQLVVSGLARGGPAESAGVRLGDVVIEVAGERVGGLADLFRKVWDLGSAGVEVPLTVARDRELSQLQVRSADRNGFLKKPPLQ
ncbi:MAG TPA: S1C family serine protease [Casimicrobiaceae bacterium]|nr:S1C family serine protease [Casimicrobiaceae bacterium]